MLYMGLLLKSVQKLQLVLNIAPWAVMCAPKTCYISALCAALATSLLLGPIEGADFDL